MASTINAITSGGGGIAVGGDTSGVIGLQSNGTTFATGNQYGIGLGTAVPSSGIGIAFPATQVPSSNANTLDDYEEGTWTPTFAGWTTAPTVFYATYTKIGRAVTINLYATGGVVAYSNISGLPFTSSAMGASVIAVRVLGYDVAFYGTVGAGVTSIVSVNQINTLIAQNWVLSFTYTSD